MVDLQRLTVPCSAHEVRTDPFANWHFLPPVVRAYYAQRICVVGAESTGKSSLARSLAKILETVNVLEYGRSYAESKLHLEDYSEWTSAEFAHIALVYKLMSEQLAPRANNYLISDTDGFQTAMWHIRYMGYESPQVEALVAQTHPQDLYILTSDDIPFKQDGTRDGESIRHHMHQDIERELQNRGYPYVKVHGNRKQRIQQALKAIRALPLKR